MSDAHRAKSSNTLLVKDDVGRAKRSVYDLPPNDFAFGAGCEPDLEGAREITMHWASHQPRQKHGPEIPDFRKVNKNAAKSGIANAKQLAGYRREGGDVMLVAQSQVGGAPKIIPSDVIPSFAYGNKSRPSTPINAVIGNQYSQEAEEMANQMYAHRESGYNASGKTKIKLTSKSKQNIADARDTRSRHENPPPVVKPWTMSKFNKVGPTFTLPGKIRKSSSSPNLSSSMEMMEM